MLPQFARNDNNRKYKKKADNMGHRKKQSIITPL